MAHPWTPLVAPAAALHDGLDRVLGSAGARP
jgi:hypothetical protein